MLSPKLQDFLDEKDVPYETIPHDQTFTAQETAASAHVPGRELAKTVLVTLDGDLAMAVLPSTRMLSLRKLKEATGAQQVEIADETEFQDRFPGIEVGAVPPFGNLWGLQVFVDRRLREDEQIAFDGGTHTELVKLTYADFERLVRPVVAELAAEA